MAKYRFEQIAINSTEKKKPVEEDRFTYLGLEHLDSGSLKVTRFGSEVAPIGEKLVMHKGDVLFGKRRAYQKKVAIAPFDGIFSAHGMVLRPREDVIDKSFFPLFISSDYFLDAAIKISVGSLSPTINWRDLKTLEFELPDLATQRKLAETLWSINDTMEAYKKLISATDELVKSQFMEHLKCHKNDTVPLKQVCIKGPQNGFYRKGAEENGTVPIMKMKQLFGNAAMCEAKDCDLVSITDSELSRFRLTPNDLLFGRRSLVVDGAGKCRRVGEIAQEAIFESSMLRITLDPNKVKPRYLQEWFDSDDGVKAIKSIRAVTTIAGIKGSDLANLNIPIVPLKEQNDFLLFVQQSDKSKFELEKALSELTATYKRIIAENLG